MYKYIVYKTTNKINGYIYVGVHRTNVDIFDGYIGDGLYNSIHRVKQFRKYKFHNAVKKYGVQNFIRETLFEYEDSEEGKKAAYKKEAEIVNRDFIKRPDVYNTVLGGRVPSSVNEKEVAQYNLDGTFIRMFYSIAHAAQTTGISNSGIRAACVGEIRYCKGFQWKFFTGNTDNIDATETIERRVYQFDLQGNYITSYKSAVYASEATGIHAQIIGAVCRGSKKSSHGYYFSYEKHFKYKPSNTTGLAVACYNDDGIFIKSFKNMRTAALELNLSHSNIQMVVAGYRKRCGGYRWRYFYGNTANIESLKD